VAVNLLTDFGVICSFHALSILELFSHIVFTSVLNHNWRNSNSFAQYFIMYLQYLTPNFLD